MIQFARRRFFVASRRSLQTQCVIQGPRTCGLSRSRWKREWKSAPTTTVEALSNCELAMVSRGCASALSKSADIWKSNPLLAQDFISEFGFLRQWVQHDSRVHC